MIRMKFLSKKPCANTLSEHTVWPELQKKLAGDDICYRQAKSTSLGVRILPERVIDYRKITKLLESKKIPHSLVIICGVNQAVSEDQVRYELSNKRSEGALNTSLVITSGCSCQCTINAPNILDQSLTFVQLQVFLQLWKQRGNL